MHVQLRTLCNASERVKTNIDTRICEQMVIASTSKPRVSPTPSHVSPSIVLCLSNEKLLIFFERVGRARYIRGLRKLGSRSELSLAHGPVRGVVAMQ